MNKNNSILEELYKLKLFGFNYIDKSKVLKQNNIKLPNNLMQLDNIVDNCNLCELSNQSRNKTMYKNNINSKIVILVSFKLNNNQYNMLDKIFEKYFNISINNILILNLIKCNIKNANINKKCFDICKDYTIKQLEILNPNYILSFGEMYKYLINDILSIGQKIRYNDSQIYYINDLDFILRNPSCLDKYENIFTKIKNKMEKK
jgi:DNA polymerase